MLDVAIIPSVVKQRATDSTFSGRANIFVLPHLNSGCARYHVAARFGQQDAIAPNLYCLARSAIALSRGCSSEAAYGMNPMTAIQTLHDRDNETLNTRVKS
mmetsp:Transcript_22265/g.28550  ORF Transcript_22265/g.28550 Transcript_22265/m.28550 type:complete len:101 (+) Transcript_22265:371-673(+)